MLMLMPVHSTRCFYALALTTSSHARGHALFTALAVTPHAECACCAWPLQKKQSRLNIIAHLKAVLNFLRSEVLAQREDLGDEAAAMLGHLTVLKVDLLDKMHSTFYRQPDDVRQQVACNGPVFMPGWDIDPRWATQSLPSKEEVLEWLELRVKKVRLQASGAFKGAMTAACMPCLRSCPKCCAHKHVITDAIVCWPGAAGSVQTHACTPQQRMPHDACCMMCSLPAEDRAHH